MRKEMLQRHLSSLAGAFYLDTIYDTKYNIIKEQGGTIMVLEDYLKLNYRLEFVPDEEEGGYAAYFPELPGCITMGDTIEEAATNAVEAKRVWLEAALEDNIPIPMPESKEKYSGQFKLRLPKTLHKLLTEHAREDGISLNQYCVYLLSRNDALLNG